MAPASDAGSLVRTPKLRGYRPAMAGGQWAMDLLDGQPIFTWRWLESMRRDPQVQFGLRVLRAPLAQVRWKVRARDPRVARFVDTQCRRVWRKALGQITRMFEPGFAAGETVYRRDRGLAAFDRLIDVHFRDAEPLEYSRGRGRGLLAGVRVNHARDEGDGQVDLRAPWAFWCANEAEYGNLYGQSRLRGAFPAWREKRGKHGAVDSRKLYHHKCAFTGGSIRYPPGMTDMGDETTGPILVSNQDIAAEIMEKFENGGILILPNVRDKTTGEYLWQFEAGKYGGDAAGLLEYPRELDREILIGLGIPPEIVSAEVVGGWAGRSVPLLVFLASLDESVHTILEAVERHILHHLVWCNFGRGQRYEIEPQPLAKGAPAEAKDARGQLGQQAPDNPADAAVAALNQGDVTKLSATAIRAEARELGRRLYPELDSWERGPNGRWRLVPVRMSRGFTGVKKDSLDREYHYVDGRRVSSKKHVATARAAHASAGSPHVVEGSDERMARRAQRRAKIKAKVKEITKRIKEKAVQAVADTAAQVGAHGVESVTGTANDWIASMHTAMFDAMSHETGISTRTLLRVSVVVASHVVARIKQKFAERRATKQSPPAAEGATS